MNDGSATSPRGRPPVEFVLTQKLREVHILLDFISARTEKSLEAVFRDAKPPMRAGPPTDPAEADALDTTQLWLERICAIAWTRDQIEAAARASASEAADKNTIAKMATDAANVIRAADLLTSAAKPANGASIAFTWMVGGDEEKDGWFRGLWTRMRRPLARSSKASAEKTREHQNGKQISGAAESGTTETAVKAQTRNLWRRSLAQEAFPGLIDAARCLRWFVVLFPCFLVVWLALTLLLSWHIAAGQAILTRVSALETQKSKAYENIAASELEDAKRPSKPQKPDQNTPPASPGSPQGADQGTTTPPSASAPTQNNLQTSTQLAEPSLPPSCLKNVATQVVDPDRLVEQVNLRRLCDNLSAVLRTSAIAKATLVEWLKGWQWAIPAQCWSGSDPECAKKAGYGDDSSAMEGQIQWASVLIGILSGAVLPILYGFLGAGAAVLRNILSKMRASVLSPRDLRIAIGELALAVLIAACIGLFINSSGSESGGSAGGITVPNGITPSALSFIAGFGVEAVYATLESLIRRVFNLPDPAQKARA